MESPKEAGGQHRCGVMDSIYDHSKPSGFRIRVWGEDGGLS